MKNLKYYLVAILTVIGIALALLISGCNSMTKSYGGTMTIDLPANKKLINVTWKDSDLWSLTRDMKPNETADTYTFQEKSDMGILEGTVILVEHK